MRAWMVLSIASLLVACGSRNDETGREPHGGDQATDGSDGNALACTQLTLTGTVAGFKYERSVTCSAVAGAALTTIDDHTEIALHSAKADVELLRLKFKETIPSSLYSGPGQVFIALNGEAAFGNCEATGEFPSGITVDQANHGTFDLVDLHYIKQDGTCGEAFAGTVHGTWTTAPVTP